MKRKQILVNFLAFQFAWFACVASAAAGIPSLGTAVCAGAVMLHLTMASRKRAESVLLSIAVCTGLLFESLLAASGWVRYMDGAWLPGLAPYWIVALWAVFATTLNVSLRWMHGRYRLAALLGAVCGPLSYLAGARLGGMTFIEPLPALIMLALGWGVIMPLLTACAGHLNGRPGRYVIVPRSIRA